MFKKEKKPLRKRSSELKEVEAKSEVLVFEDSLSISDHVNAGVSVPSVEEEMKVVDEKEKVLLEKEFFDRKNKESITSEIERLMEKQKAGILTDGEAQQLLNLKSQQ